MTRSERVKGRPRTLVLGATGKTGRRVAARLEERGASVVRGSRTGRPPFDWADPAGYRMALAGVQAAYVVYPADLPIEGATDRIGALVAEARRAGVGKLVLLTGRGEDEGARQEQLVQESGIASTIVRSAWFDQNFTEGGFADLVATRTFDVPADTAPEPFVDLEDVADVAAAALQDARHDGQVYEVTGPRLLTLTDVAAELSRAIGTPIRCSSVPLPDYLAELAQSGADTDTVALMEFLFGTLLDGRNARVGDGVERALGRPPRDFSDFARRAAATGAFRKEVA